VERANRDVQDILSTLLDAEAQEQRDAQDSGDEDEVRVTNWAERLKYVQHMKNRALHQGIRTSPFEVMFGRSATKGLANLPADVMEAVETEEQLRAVLEGRPAEPREPPREDAGKPIPLIPEPFPKLPFLSHDPAFPSNQFSPFPDDLPTGSAPVPVGDAWGGSSDEEGSDGGDDLAAEQPRRPRRALVFKLCTTRLGSPITWNSWNSPGNPIHDP
jgi:hypothetical protein